MFQQRSGPVRKLKLRKETEKLRRSSTSNFYQNIKEVEKKTNHELTSKFSNQSEIRTIVFIF
jgi:hypothetical protein